MNLGAIQTLLSEKGLSWQDLCEKTGITELTMGTSIVGDKFSFNNACLIADALGVKIDDILFDEDKDKAEEEA